MRKCFEEFVEAKRDTGPASDLIRQLRLLREGEKSPGTKTIFTEATRMNHWHGGWLPFRGQVG